MEIRRPEHPLVYMKCVRPHGRKHGRKRSKRDSEAAPQLTVNVLLLPARHQPSAPVLTEADGTTIIDITNSEED